MEKTGKVAYIAKKLNDTRAWDIKGMLQTALKELSEEVSPVKSPNKAVLILLDDKEDSYGFGWYTTNIGPSEILALTELVSSRCKDTLKGEKW